MSVLYAGVEDFDIEVFRSGIGIQSNPAYFRSGFARYCITPNSLSAYSLTTDFSGGAVTSCWFDLRVRFSGGANAANFGLCNSGASPPSKGLWFGKGSTENKFAIFKYDGTTFTKLAEESGELLPLNTVIQLSIQVINYGASATVNVYLDGSTTPLVTYSGDVTVGGVSNLNCIGLRWTGNYAWYSESIVADEDTRQMSVITLYPNAAGDSNDWDGAYTAIDESNYDINDTIYTDTADEDFLCNLSGTPAGANLEVKAIRIAARAFKTADASIETLEIGVKSGSIDRYMPLPGRIKGFTSAKALYMPS